jgi:Ca2+/Na+ antiporter
MGESSKHPNPPGEEQSAVPFSYNRETRREHAERLAWALGQAIAILLFLCFVFLRSTRADLWIGLVVGSAYALVMVVIYLLPRGDPWYNRRR